MDVVRRGQTTDPTADDHDPRSRVHPAPPQTKRDLERLPKHPSHPGDGPEALVLPNRCDSVRYLKTCLGTLGALAGLAYASRMWSVDRYSAMPSRMRAKQICSVTIHSG